MAAASCARRARAVQQQQPRHQAGQRLPGLLRQRPPAPPLPGRPPREAGRRGRIAELGSPASPGGGGLGGVAWASPRFWSGEFFAAVAAAASVSNRRRAESAPTSTRGRGATNRGTQASRSNIQAGTSRRRPPSPPRLHRNAVAPPLSLTSWTRTERPLQGCHGYKSVRSVVLWALRRSCTTAYVRMPPSASGRPRRKWCWPPSPPGPRRYAGRPRQPHRSWRPGRR